MRKPHLCSQLPGYANLAVSCLCKEFEAQLVLDKSLQGVSVQAYFNAKPLLCKRVLPYTCFAGVNTSCGVQTICVKGLL